MIESSDKAKDLLKIYSLTLKTLKNMEVVRSMNSPVGDYAEWYVKKKLRLDPVNNSNKGYDATDSEGKYQIKGRLLLEKKDSRQLGVIRNLEEKLFDYLIAVLFDSEFNAFEIWKIPHGIIDSHARYSEHQHGHILVLHGAILVDPSAVRMSKIEEKSVFE